MIEIFAFSPTAEGAAAIWWVDGTAFSITPRPYGRPRDQVRLAGKSDTHHTGAVTATSLGGTKDDLLLAGHHHPGSHRTVAAMNVKAERARAMLERSSAAIAVIDRGYGIVATTAAAQALLSVGQEAPAPRSLLDVVGPTQRRALFAHLAQCAAAPGMPVWTHLSCARDPGDPLILEARHVLVPELDAIVGTYRDVTNASPRDPEQGRPAHPTLLQPNEVVATTVTTLARLFDARVEIVTKLDPALAMVTMGRAQLEQVLMNLALNARDATTACVRAMVRIETRNFELLPEQAAMHGHLQAGQYVLLSITDNGTGMSEGVRERAFDPFFTTKAPVQGAGLGLTIVRGIVQANDGVVWLTSEPGIGSTAHVLLPPSPAAAARA